MGSRDIKVSDTVIPNDPTTAPEVCFSLQKEESKDAAFSRAMSFGEDFPTRKFRSFLSYMIKYKLYAEENQKAQTLMDPKIERFLKISEEMIKQKFRSSVVLKD